MKTLVSTTTPSVFLFSIHFSNSSSQFSHLKLTTTQLRFTCLSSPSSSSSVVEEEQHDTALPFNGCKGCGRNEIESGCNGDGRIQGGIATIPGFGWWPIKAYRPCPGFLASGGSYKRRGQSMDEVAFGRGGAGASMPDFDNTETRKKGKNRKQFKS
ncbi:hypothetical protein RND81_13G059100 [Saponaria officinalis]|uniref:Uncharacterized protein n=1 Tax=Saponaria officinalis TaxID=3572 RepID=A0AAW1GXB7_SAPOF